MTRRVTIWTVSGSVVQSGSTQSHWRFFPTKAEAIAYVKSWEDDGQPSGDPLTVNVLHVTPNRDGIAKALDDFVDMTCLNE